MFPAMAQRKTLLIVDDDQDLRGAVAEQLQAEDFITLEAATAGDGVRLAQASGLTSSCSTSICRTLTAARPAAGCARPGVSAPVIMLTAAAADDETVQGLDAGANDYVTKPYKFAVLLARIRAQLRSAEQSEAAVYRLGAYEFRPAAKMLLDPQQKKIRLTEKETNILKYLYRAGEKPVSREELLAEVWGYNAGVTTHTLETHVYRLRQKIETDPANAKLLLTEAGGYRLAP